MKAAQKEAEGHNPTPCLTVGMALLLYPAKFCTLHPENQFLLWLNCPQPQTDSAGENWSDKRGWV